MKFNVAVHVRRDGIRLILLSGRIHDIADTFNGDSCLAHLGDHPPQRPDRPGQHSVIGNKCNKFPCRHTAPDTEYRPQDDDQHDLKTGDQVAGTPKQSHESAQFDPHVGVNVILLFKPVFFILFPAESAHYPDAGQVFLCYGG